MCSLILTQLNELKLGEMDESLKHLVPGEVPKRETSTSLSKELDFWWPPPL